MPRRAKPPPDGSWVLEGDDESSDASPAYEGRQHVPMTPPRSSILRNQAEGFSSAPELVMPSMHVDTPSSATPKARRRVQSPSPTKSPQPSTASNLRLRKGARAKQEAVYATDDTDDIRHYLGLIWTNLMLPVVQFLASTLRVMLSIARPFLIYLAALWILAVGLRYLLRSTIAKSLAPICYIPGSAYLNLPFCAPSQHQAGGPVEFDQLMTVQSAFDDVLSSAVSGATLPLDMKRGEASIRDLKHVVQFSSLPSRNELVFEFGGFIETARQASGDLTRFNSRIGRAIDNVLNTNRWTLQVIDGVAERDAARGAVGRMLDLTPFYSPRVTEELVFEQYLKHTAAIEEQIAELIIEAQALLAILQNLDDRLDVIHSITTRDGVSIQGTRDELLGQLWTRLGGNRSSLKKQGDQLTLLRQVGFYRKTAWDHVSATLLKLQSIAAGLEDLRERVAAPEVLGQRSDVPLRMHIEHIQLGVERLEAQRTEARRVEGEMHRRVLDRGAEADAKPQQQQRGIEGDLFAKLQ